jgi:hypothetical protein
VRFLEEEKCKKYVFRGWNTRTVRFEEKEIKMDRKEIGFDRKEVTLNIFEHRIDSLLISI